LAIRKKAHQQAIAGSKSPNSQDYVKNLTGLALNLELLQEVEDNAPRLERIFAHTVIWPILDPQIFANPLMAGGGGYGIVKTLFCLWP
jgi:hypothetical protein